MLSPAQLAPPPVSPIQSQSHTVSPAESPHVKPAHTVAPAHGEAHDEQPALTHGVTYTQLHSVPSSVAHNSATHRDLLSHIPAVVSCGMTSHTMSLTCADPTPTEHCPQASLPTTCCVSPTWAWVVPLRALGPGPASASRLHLSELRRLRCCRSRANAEKRLCSLWAGH